MRRKSGSKGARATESKASAARKARAAERARTVSGSAARPDVETASDVRIGTVTGEDIATGAVRSPDEPDATHAAPTTEPVAISAAPDVASDSCAESPDDETSIDAAETEPDAPFVEALITSAVPTVTDAPLSAPIEGIAPRDEGDSDAGDEDDDDDDGAEPGAGAADATDGAATADHTDVTAWPDLPILHPQAAELAHQLRIVCDDCEAGLAAAVQTRQEQEMAWLVLCDRGWPADQMVAAPAIPVVEEWLACWRDFIAMPVKIDGIRDRFRMRGVQQRLEKVETALRPLLPPAVWTLVTPLDATGRATLAYILQGIHDLEATRTRAQASRRLREQLIARFNALRGPTIALGIEPPDAPLDTAYWRKVAAAAYRIATRAS